jgi:hypothetical protein
LEWIRIFPNALSIDMPTSQAPAREITYRVAARRRGHHFWATLDAAPSTDWLVSQTQTDATSNEPHPSRSSASMRMRVQPNALKRGAFQTETLSTM